MINSPTQNLERTDFNRIKTKDLGQSALAETKLNMGATLESQTPVQERHTFGQVLGASFKQENILGNFLNNTDTRALQGLASDVPNPDFDAVKYAAPEDERYLPWTVNAINEDQYNALLFKVRGEMANRQILEENPGRAFLAGFLSNGLDPSILLPGGVLFKEASLALSALRSAASVGLAAAGSSVVQEIGLHAQQETRTLRESAFNVLTTGLVGGMIGGLVGPAFGGQLGKLARDEAAGIMDYGLNRPMPWNESRVKALKDLDKIEKETGKEQKYNPSMDKNFEATSKPLTYPRLNLERSVGAKETDIDLIRQSESFGGGFLSKIARGGVGWDIPMMKLAKDSFTTSKQIIGLTTEHNMLLNKNLPVNLTTITKGAADEASGHAVETLINIDKGRFENALIKYHDKFLEYKGVKPGSFFAPERAALNKTGGNRIDFGRATFNQVINPQDNAHPKVKEAADIIHNEIFEPIKQAFIDEGIFPPDISVTTAARYFMRVYNRDLIKSAAGNAQFAQAIKPWIIEQNELLKELMPQIKDLEELIGNLEKTVGVQVENSQAFVKAEANIEKVRNKTFSELSALKKNQTQKLKSIDEEIAARKYEADDKLAKAEKGLREAETEFHQKIDEEETKYLELSDKIDKEIEAAKTRNESHIQVIKNEMADVEANREKFVNDKAANKKIRELKAEQKEAKKQLDEFVKKQEKIIKKAEKILEARKRKAKEEQKKKIEKETALITETRKIERARIEELKKNRKALETQFELAYESRNRALAAEEKKYEKLKEESKGLTPEEAQKQIDAELKAAQQKLDELVPKDSPLRDSSGKIRRVLEDHEYDTVVENTIDNVLGRGEDALLNPVLTRLTGSKPSPMASRVFLIPDERIADFLVTDPLDVIPMFTNATIPYLHLIRLSKALEEKFPNKARKPPKEGQGLGDFESPFSVEDGKANLRRQLKEELDQRRQAAGTNEKLVHKLEKEFDQAVKALDDTYDMLLGRYGMGPNVLDGKAAKVAKTIGTWNFTRFMGFLGISALPDLGAIALKNGVFRFLFDGFLPVLSKIKENGHLKELMQDMGMAIETYKGMMSKGAMGRDGLLTDSGIFSKGINYIATRYGNATLASQFRDFSQFVAGRVSLSRTLRAIDEYVKTGKMSEKEKTRLNALGLHKQHFKAIHDEWGRIGGKSEGAYWINFNHWSDASPELTSALANLKAALYKDINSTILEAGGGIGDVPLFFKNPLGSMMFQFKKYFFQASNRLLLPAIQRGDREAWEGAAMMITLGGVAWMIKGMVRGEEMDLSFENVAINAIDQSGLAAQYGVYYGVLSSFGLGIAPSRYNNVGQIGNVLGPLAGSVGDIANFGNIVRDPDRHLTTKNYEKLVRLLPYQNYPPLYRVGKSLGRNIGLAFGAEESTQ